MPDTPTKATAVDEITREFSINCLRNGKICSECDGTACKQDKKIIEDIIERRCGAADEWRYKDIPKNGERVLMTVRYDDEYGIRDLVGIGSAEKQDDGSVDVEVDDGIDGFSLYKECKVYAWMPLPEPARYKEAEHERI